MKQDFIETDHFYHIFNRGNNRENIFKENKNYRFFLDLVKKHLPVISEIYSFCLMPNHFHLLIRIKDYESIPKKYQKRLHQPLANLFNAYSKAINKAYDRSGSLFQKPYHRKRIMDEKHLTQVIAYIHLNPVKHGYTEDAESWAYSSYQIILSNKPTLIEREKVLNIFNDLDNYIYWHNWKSIHIVKVLEEIEQVDE